MEEPRRKWCGQSISTLLDFCQRDVLVPCDVVAIERLAFKHLELDRGANADELEERGNVIALRRGRVVSSGLRGAERAPVVAIRPRMQLDLLLVSAESE
jgi:hypothetical protein